MGIEQAACDAISQLAREQLTGARVVSAPRPDGLGFSPMAWPLSQPVASFQVPDADQFTVGVSHLVGASDAEALFSLRDNVLAQEANAMPMDQGIPVEGNFVVFVCEEVPFTNAAGLQCDRSRRTRTPAPPPAPQSKFA